MPNYLAATLKSTPGIERDSTKCDSESYVDGQWVRFYKNLPRKMGGMNALNVGTIDIIRNMFSVPVDASIDLYLGRNNSISYLNVTFNGVTSDEVDRTPLTGFTPDANNSWTFDLFSDSTSLPPTSYVCAQVSPNLMDITGTTEGPIFYGDKSLTTPLQQVVDANSANAPVLVSGFIIYSAPILIAGGNDGIIRWTNPNKILEWSNGGNLNIQAIAGTKLVAAARTGSTNEPALLFWSLNSLIRAQYSADPTNPNLTLFQTQTLEENITIISPNCVIKYDNIFFWVGVDQFYCFNGVVQTLPNTMSTDWFFDNVDMNYRCKIFGLAVRRYHELWWFYVKKGSGATEPTDVIIYNLQEKRWYDTILSRTAGVPATTFPSPIMADGVLTTIPTRTSVSTTYPIWQHEYGTDKIIGGYTFPIQSYFQTHYINLFKNDGRNNVLTRTRRIEPDFISTGEMSVTVYTRAFPQDTDTILGPFVFNTDPNNRTKKIDYVNIQGRFTSYRFESNTVGGYYQAGSNILDYNEGDVIP